MSDFLAALVGAVIGSAATLGASVIAYRSVLNVERGKAERRAVADLMAAAYDLDTAMGDLSAASNAKGEHATEDFVRADEAVRSSGRILDRFAYLVRDDKLRQLALDLEKTAFGERVGLYPSTVPRETHADLQRVRQARDAVAARAAQVVKDL